MTEEEIQYHSRLALPTCSLPRPIVLPVGTHRLSFGYTTHLQVRRHTRGMSALYIMLCDHAIGRPMAGRPGEEANT
jgi:hypothetical protein